MEIDLDGIVIIVGNYGSGKTEVSINLAVNRKRAGLEVRIADLDLVNPYFRTREAKRQLAELGIEVVVPPRQYMQADLPILSPVVAGMIRRPSQLTLLDTGGNDVGVNVFAALGDALSGRRIHVLQVVNPFRPFTAPAEGCLKIRNEIEKASRLSISGIIGNANLIDETSARDIYTGYDFVLGLSKESGLPLKFITVAAELMPEIYFIHFTWPVLLIERQLVPQRKRSVPLASKME
ncbi:MAG: hypothetical protein PF495_15345 [Spirochaetales bacterium]|nr:hypothetical protein [Spirochaetales bacterium]